ncbi:cytochrome P450, putative [Ricinus communis]|uniref:Cytochrome P450, putative n=1 Tax=Ricinus communis TaxID=3988 RepID=B9T8H5_RICCO|nr:cytochrome P450, putative [Ricinus communis]
MSNSPYGSTWRALRRNLTGGVLHPSQLKSFSHARKRVLDNLIAGLEHDSKDNKAIYVAEHFRYAIFSLLVLLCFGDNIDDNQMKEIEVAQKESFLSYQRMKLFFIMPKLGKFFFRKLWNELNNAMINCNNVFLFMVRSRKQEISARKNQESLSYVDTLLDFQLPGEEGTLAENHIVGLCSEFITAGTDSTTSALQWIMACIVKYPSVQAKVYEEMKAVLGQENQWVQEDDLQKMPYLRAVILEGLRRHPPGYAPATPHAVTEDVELGGYTLPKGTAVNFLIPDIGRDPNVWEHPLEFKPERLLKSDDTSEDDSFDITGKGEIKMMPFGAGRRICPGNGVAMLHLTYIVANLVWHFEWSPPDGEEVDLTEKYEITISMKRALKACLSPRFK